MFRGEHVCFREGILPETKKEHLKIRPFQKETFQIPTIPFSGAMVVFRILGLWI